MNNNDLLKNIIEYIKDNEELLDYLSGECDLDFEDDEELADDLSFLTENAKSNYKLEPFACDGEGGIYALLDGEMVGMIDSEGQSGIVAKNIRDFFSIIIHCGYLKDFGKFGWLEDHDEFSEHFIEIEEDFLEDFSEEFQLETDPQKIFQMFREAVQTQPQLKITATSEDYDDYQQIFEF
ncbi:hypothetical protein [Ruminococcus albus]|uniref:Uncharacterized protein n=1 Tax=Ruminococcus albus TaxID=1264 RepID=A0A1I1D2D9_RUMAL|nr:hypothetical protein [Ruminococcus albus]SFB66783.1 hypothetical protein SAMN02910406_00123 [Ruminococcus albus]